MSGVERRVDSGPRRQLEAASSEGETAWAAGQRIPKANATHRRTQKTKSKYNQTWV